MASKSKSFEHETLTDLVKQAYAMFIDRSKEEQDLIYYIAKLDNEARAAIIIAYQYVLHAED